jgi:epoxyqueuosine reductase
VLLAGVAAGFGVRLRNVAVALGNWGAPEAVPALTRALEDPEPLVRGHAAWALGRIGTAEALAALEVRLEHQDDRCVREEIRLAFAPPPPDGVD